MTNTSTVEKLIAEAIRSGEDPLACGCMGCQDKVDKVCPCGMSCKCRCTLPHRVDQQASRKEQVEAIRKRIANE